MQCMLAFIVNHLLSHAVPWTRHSRRDPTVFSTVVPSPTMMGGVNIAAVVAIPVVLVLLPLVIGVVMMGVLYYNKRNNGFLLR